MRLRRPGVRSCYTAAALIRSPMIEPGRGWGYVALFSEIGISLLVTTLVGVLVGYWVDEQLGTVPVFVIDRLLRRRRGRDRDDLQTGQPVPEDDSNTPVCVATGQGGRERGVEPRSCVWSKRVERAGRDREVAEAPEPQPKRGRGLSSRWFMLIGARHRPQHRRAHPRPAVPQGRPAGRRVRLPGLLHQRHARVPGAARRLGAGRRRRRRRPA